MPKGIYDRKKARRKTRRAKKTEPVTEGRIKRLLRRKPKRRQPNATATSIRRGLKQAITLHASPTDVKSFRADPDTRPYVGRIKTVSFRSMVELARFQHVHIEADVPNGVNPAETLEMLKMFVAEELRGAKEGKPAVERVPGRFRDMLEDDRRPGWT